MATIKPKLVLVAGLLSLATVQTVQAQNSSLYRQDTPVQGNDGVRLANGSWTFIPPPPQQEIRLNDLVYVRVTVGSEVLSEGDAQVRKSGVYNATLKEWIVMDGLRWIKPAPMSDGAPRIEGLNVKNRQAQSYVETKDSMQFDIQARIVDIRPNGNLILEARRDVKNNEEQWEFSLTGECRAQDIGTGNILLSKNIADLKIDKRERGQVRDGYKRGWFLKWFDSVLDPF
ncbi:MAG TPA: flagellar basal body L-ring protein FlgH [Pirellulaceae bacterium]|nr:flagellar basal body L-ring protein FlgH [Pirellulaceae bacterium]